MTEQWQRTTLPVCPECGSATFWNNTDGVQTFFCMSDDCKWKQQIRSRPAPAADAPCLPKTPLCDKCYKEQIEHAAAVRKEAYEYGKRDALLEKENLKVSTIVGYEAGYEQGAKDERERVLDEVKDGVWKKTFAPDGFSPSYHIVPWNDVKEVIESLRREGAEMKEQLIQILERERGTNDQWKVRTVIQLWPKRDDERNRLQRFMDEEPTCDTP